MSTVKTLHRRKKLNFDSDPYSFNVLPAFKEVNFDKDDIVFTLQDERIIKIPISWVSRLNTATNEQRLNYSIQGHFNFWDDIDEVIAVKNLLDGSVVPK